MKIVLLLAILFTLSGCGGGAKVASSEPPLEISKLTIYGNVGPNTTVGSRVRVYQSNELLEIINSDSKGYFEAEIKAPKYGLVKLVVDSGIYSELYDGEVSNIDAQYSFLSYFDYYGQNKEKINVDFSTTIMAALIDFGFSYSESINAVSSWVGFNPANSDRSENYDFFGVSEKKSLFNGAVSALASINSQEFNKLNTSKLAQIAYSDITHDGLLNGSDSFGDIYIGTNRIDSSTYRSLFAASIIEFKNKFNLSIADSDLISYVSNIENHSGLLFGGISNDGSVGLITLTDVFPVENSVISGSVFFEFSISSDYGFSKALVSFGNEQPLEYLSKGVIHTFNTTELVDGEYDLKVIVFDMGNKKYEYIFKYKVLNNGSMISSLNPNNKIIRGVYDFSSTMISVYGVSSPKFSIGNTSHNPIERSNSEFYKTIDTANFNDGVYSFSASFVDWKGVSISKSTTFEIDNTAPLIGNMPINEGDYLKEEKSFTVGVSDKNGIDSQLILINGSVKCTSFSNCNFGYNDLSDGSHKLKTVAVDSVGNSAFKEVNFIVDKEPPVAAITFPKNGDVLTSSFNIEWQVYDNNGIKSIDIFVGGVKYANGSINHNDHPININNRERGNNEIKLVVTDNSGRITTTGINVFFDK